MLAAGLVLLLTGPAYGQGGGRPAGGTLFVEAGHWSIAAARRLEAADLAPHGYDPFFRTPSRGELLHVFVTATERAERQGRLRWAATAATYRDRMIEKFPALAETDESDGAATAGASIGPDTVAGNGVADDGSPLSRPPESWPVQELVGVAGFEHRSGALRTGIGYANEAEDSWIPESQWRGPTARSGTNAPLVAPSWTAAWPRVAIRVAPALRGTRASLEELQATALAGPFHVWAGRRAPGYGAGLGGAIVLTGGIPFDGAGFAVGPVVPPIPFDPIGPIRFETFVSRLEENGPRRRPWFWGARGSLSPHPRVRLGVSRAAIFAGVSDDPRVGSPPITLRNLARLLIGMHAGEAGEFENQVVSVDLRVRPPLGHLPLALYIDWGLHDNAGAWKNNPALNVGAELAALPGAPGIGVALERTSFDAECCGNPIWYRNWTFWGGWADEGRPLGHPLGGHGIEWLGRVHAELMHAALRLEVRAFRRERGEENLYAPDWEGRSQGGGVDAWWRVSDGMDLVLRSELDRRSRGGTTVEAALGLRVVR